MMDLMTFETPWLLLCCTMVYFSQLKAKGCRLEHKIYKRSRLVLHKQIKPCQIGIYVCCCFILLRKVTLSVLKGA